MDLEAYKKHFNENNTFLKIAGGELTKLEKGYAEVTMVTSPSVKNVAESVHGGALYTIADAAVGAASKSFGKMTVTLEGKLNYIRPARINGKAIRAIAKTVHIGRTTGVFSCDLVNEEEKILATGLFTMFILDQDIQINS